MASDKMDKIAEAYFEGVRRPTTWSGFTVKGVYAPEDLHGIDYRSDIGNPGEFPYTRGIYRDMYRGRLWSIREISGYWSGSESNQRLRYLIETGETALNIIPDNPTQQGIDPDHPLAAGDAGVQGAPLNILEDMEELTEGIPLDKVSFTFSCPMGFMYVPMYILTAQKRGYDITQLRGTSTNESLTYVGTSVGRQMGIKPPGLMVKLTTDVIEYCAKTMPLWNPVSVNSYNWREAGFNSAYEISIAFSIALEYIKEGLNRGLNVDNIASKLAFTLGCHLDFFEEIAKFRAARRVWARLMKEEWEAKDSRSWKLKYHTNTAGCSLVRQQPLNNIIRVAYEALAAVLGGTQSMHTMSYNEPICLPTEDAHMIAIRTQQILAHEIGVANVADPLAGSYYVESLTNTMEEEIRKVMREIEKQGGVIAALEKGWIYRKLDEFAYQYQKEVEDGERVIVGQNAFLVPSEQEKEWEVHKITLESMQARVAHFKELKERRHNGEVCKALSHLAREAEQRKNVMPACIEAVRARATLGEVFGTIRMAYGYDYDPFKMIGSVL